MSDTEAAFRSVLVTGGAGYVGSRLVPCLLETGYNVTVVDLFWYGREVFGEWARHPGLRLLELDIRDAKSLAEAIKGKDAVIHLACISNDPSFDLDPGLGKSINYDAFEGLLRGAIEGGVRRLVYASSSSVYGVKEEENVTEETTPEPLTDYSRFKWACERDLQEAETGDMEWIILRPATVCGYAPRLRLDLVVNLLTAHALVNRKIKVFGGEQLRPNIHIEDMVRAYLVCLETDSEKVDGQTFNVGYENLSVMNIARLVGETLGGENIELEVVPSDDIRSYHIDSDKIRRILGFKPQHTVKDAIRDLAQAYGEGRMPNALSDRIYSNIQTMKALSNENAKAG